MVAMKDMTGVEFGSLRVLRFDHSKKTTSGSTAHWLCLCNCGKETVVAGSNLRNGNTKSCGCLRYASENKNHTHKKSKTKAYQLWGAMIQRARGHRYKTYADNCIGVADEWLSFENFYADMGDPPAPGYSLERVDNNAGYRKENCKWIPMTDQWRNRRNTKLHEFQGEMLSYREIEDRIGLTHGTIRRKVSMQGLTLEGVLCEHGY